jgi:sphinganine-1-phosphate aldolase
MADDAMFSGDVPEGFPAAGRGATELRDELAAMRQGDLAWREGRSFSLVYNPDDDALEALLEEVATDFLHENGLNPFKYPSLQAIEAQVVAATCGLLGGGGGGTLTSGGTESLFLAVHTAREHARKQRPDLVLGGGGGTVVAADTVHPAVAKACHYLDLELVLVPHGRRPGCAVPRGCLSGRLDVAVRGAPGPACATLGFPGGGRHLHFR